MDELHNDPADDPDQSHRDDLLTIGGGNVWRGRHGNQE
jgi:hypothetical protein